MNDSDKTKTELVMENVHLRRKLAETEARAERMEKRYKGQLAHNEGLEVSIRARKEQIKELKAAREELLKSNPSEAERRILDMWPRFEDGEPVWFGDELDFGGDVQQVQEFRFMRDSIAIADEFDFEEFFEIGERVKRPAPEVTDADGVPINVGDTVYDKDGNRLTVDRLYKWHVGVKEFPAGVLFNPSSLTHREPDSWERLFGDASVGECCYFGRVGKDGTERCEGCPAEQADCCMSTQMEDLIRRAKALAGVE